MDLTKAEEQMVERVRRRESWEAPWYPSREVEAAVEKTGTATCAGDYELWRDKILAARAKKAKLLGEPT